MPAASKGKGTAKKKAAPRKAAKKKTTARSAKKKILYCRWVSP